MPTHRVAAIMWWRIHFDLSYGVADDVFKRILGIPADYALRWEAKSRGRYLKSAIRRLKFVIKFLVC